MRRPLVLILAVIAAAIVSVAAALSSPTVVKSLWPHLPRSIQTRPGFYFDHALDVIKTNAGRRASVDWPAVEAQARAMIKDAKTSADTYPAIRYVLEQLKDGHSAIIPTAPASSAPAGVYGFQTLFPERIVAIVYPQSAAALAGIRAGDLIELVNGAPPVASDDPRTRGYLVKVPPPSATLRLRHPGDKEARDVTLSVGPYAALPAITRRIGGDLGYVEIPGTSGQDDFPQRVRESIAQSDAPTVCGWMVDLRFNNGGALWAMLQSMRAIAGEDSLGFFVGADGSKVPWAYPTSGLFVLDPPTPLQRPGPAVAVLTSRITANSGEVAAIAFRGRPNSRSFGDATWGAPTENNPFKLPDGAVLDLATARAADRTGQIYDGRLSPDEPVAIDWSRLTAVDDPVIVAAATWLRAQPSCKK